MKALDRPLAFIALPFRTLLTVALPIFWMPKRVLGLLLPHRAAIFVFVVLTVVASVLLFELKTRIEQIGPLSVVAAVIVLLVLLCAFVVEYTVKSWLEHDVSGIAEIDDAWQRGLVELEAAGLSLCELPVFLVLGVPDEKSARSLLAASSLNLKVNGIPAGDQAALRWFVGPSACVLVLSRVGRLSRLVAKASEPVAADPGRGQVPPKREGTLRPPGEFGSTAPPGMAPYELKESFSPTVSPLLPAEHRALMDSPVQPPYIAGRGTLIPEVATPGDEQPLPGAPTRQRQGSGMPVVALSEEEADSATARLKHVCRLLRRERLPDWPINGMLTVVPFDIIARPDAEQQTGEVYNSLHMDLATLRSELQIRSQVVALFGGMEREAGFLELKRRLGPKVANEQQFGKGYNPRCPAVENELALVAQVACGAFEDWTYHLFAQKGERLSNPRGNRQLYALVCKIRSLQQQIERIIVHAFAASDDSGEKPHLFSGCYFAATGDREDRRAFIPGVFKNRLLAQDCDVEWTSAARAENGRYELWANLLGLLDTALIVFIVTMIAIAIMP
jgi:hypothetical protein